MRTPIARVAVLATCLATLGGATAASAQEDPSYRSPMKEQCNAELDKDIDWYYTIKNRFVDQYFFDARKCSVDRPPDVRPERNFQEGYASPMREQCEAELRKDLAWLTELRVRFDAELSYEFQDRNSRTFLTNRRHVVMAYGAILVILAGFAVSLFLRQRSLVAELERLKADVERAAAD